MKTIKSLALVAIIFSAALFLQNCAKENIIPNAIETQKDVLPSDMNLDQILVEADYLLENPEFTDASEEKDLSMLNDGIPFFLEDDDHVNFDGTDHAGKLRKGRCDSLWIKMALTDTQKRQLRRAHTAYMTCKIRPHTALKNLHKSYMRKAAAERAKLIQAYRNGRITRAQLAQKLTVLNKRLRAAIQADPQRKALIKALKACHTKYLRTLHSILTPQQWAMLMKCKRALYRHGRTGTGKGGGKTVYDCPPLRANFGDLCKDSLRNMGRIDRNCKCDTALFRKGGGNTGGGTGGGNGRGGKP